MSPTRWFDENGNEIFHERVNPEELKPLLEVGGMMDTFKASLHFNSEKLDKEEITRLLGVEPERAWNPGEMHKIGNSNKSKITDWGLWYYSTKRDSIELDLILKHLLDIFPKELDNWKILTSKYQAWIRVSGHMNNWNREFGLSAEVMKLLSERGLEISFDIYFYGDDDDDE